MHRERAYRLLALLGGLLLVALSGRARAEEPSALTLTATPERLQLGQDAEARLTILTDPAATGLQLFVSRGEVSAPEAEAPGRFRATFRPPRERYPQVAILAAVAQGPRGALHGWTVLPLWGQGTAEVRTTPGASVSLRVGSRVFGPLTADAEGRARVPVRVPPGVEEAFYGQRHIPLGVPPLPRVQAIVEQPVLLGDAAREVTVRLYAVTPEGKPLEGASFQLEATRGAAARAEALAPGVSVVRWTLPAGPPGEVELRGGIPGDVRSAFRVKVRVVPGPARHWALDVDRDTVTADEDARVKVSVRALDDAGNPAEAELRLASDVGEGVALRALGDGRYEGSLVLPARLGGRDSVKLQLLLATGSEAPLLSRQLRWRPAAPARVTVTPLVPRAVTDGTREVGYRVAVEDRFGNPVREPPAVASASEPVGAPRPSGPGAWELRYVPAAVDEVSEARVEVRAGEAVGRAGFLLEPRRFRAATALRAGVVTDFGRLQAPLAGAQVELRPEGAVRPLGLALSADALSFGGLGEGTLPGFSGRNTFLSLSAALTVHVWPAGRWELWGAAGPALAWVDSRVRLGNGPALQESARVWGAQASVGVGRRLGPGVPFLEARVLWFADPALDVLRGELRGVGLAGGYRLELF